MSKLRGNQRQNYQGRVISVFPFSHSGEDMWVWLLLRKRQKVIVIFTDSVSVAARVKIWGRKFGYCPPQDDKQCEELLKVTRSSPTEPLCPRKPVQASAQDGFCTLSSGGFKGLVLFTDMTSRKLGLDIFQVFLSHIKNTVRYCPGHTHSQQHKPFQIFRRGVKPHGLTLTFSKHGRRRNLGLGVLPKGTSAWRLGYKPPISCLVRPCWSHPGVLVWLCTEVPQAVAMRAMRAQFYQELLTVCVFLSHTGLGQTGLGQTGPTVLKPIVNQAHLHSLHITVWFPTIIVVCNTATDVKDVNITDM